MMPSSDNSQLRRWVYALLITTAFAGVCGRILSTARTHEPGLYRAEGDVNSPLGEWPKTRPEPTPTHGANDRSRWDTVRALIDNGTYVIGHREFDDKGQAVHDAITGQIKDDGIITKDGWKTIDLVLKPGTSDFYSSKPPFLPTLLAGEYWGLKQLFGWSIVEDRYWVIRTILLTFNAIPFLVYLFLFSRLLESLSQSDWGRLYLMTALCFGTLITPFLVTLNNHTLAACTALFALYPTVLDWRTAKPMTVNIYAALAGFFAAFTACNELPAASLAAGLLVIWVFRGSWPAVVFFILAALIPIAGFLTTNKLAIDQFVPAYGEFGGTWYEYEGSHWLVDPNKPKQGIDWAGEKESRGAYAFHLLLGHHGLFSLTPVFILSLGGFAYGIVRLVKDKRLSANLTWLSLLTLVLTLVLLAFYILYLPVGNHNYGGWTIGARWLLWLTPLLLLSAIPAADWLGARRWGQGLGYMLLAVSVFSASYPAWNPWRHPWLYNLLNDMNWVSY